jgi:uncharacterized membrane protein YqiK
MADMLLWILPFSPLILGVLAALVLWRPLLGVVSIPQNNVGLVNKKFVLFGKNKALPDGQIIALHGEAGIQADTLAPGLYFGYFPWQYKVTRVDFVVIPDGKVGIVEASGGNPIPSGRVLAKSVACDSFQNARAFLEGGGERGPQITASPPGTYRVNPALFKITTTEAMSIPQGKVGVVTTKEGTPLPTGEIAGKETAGHSGFQNGQAFIDNGGFKGLQEQVLLAGTYYLNPNFVSVELVDMTPVPIGNVGVVIAYVGDKGENIAGEAFKQGNIVERGNKGVWNVPLDPGKYAINPYTHAVKLVPTTNIVLNWAEAKSEAHHLDDNLSFITVRSSDGFTFNLDVQQIIHIARDNASKVIARFGDMINLVTQVLEPLIGNYFRNSSQKSDVIEFLRNREQRQIDATAHIKAALDLYDVQAVDTLIGDITPPPELMKTLTDRKVAEQQQITYAQQETAQTARAKLTEQQALADTKGQIVQAQRSVEIADLNAQAAVKTADGAAKSRVLAADGEAKAKIALADGDAQAAVLSATAKAKSLTLTGDAQGSNTLATQGAEAKVLKQKVDAVGSNAYALMQVMNFLAENKIRLVPDIQVTGTGEGGHAGLLDAFLGTMLAQMRSAPTPPAGAVPPPASS